jgi:hypothetical protein
VGNDSRGAFYQKPLGEDGNVRRGVDMVKQAGLFSPKYVHCGVTEIVSYISAAKI